MPRPVLEAGVELVYPKPGRGRRSYPLAVVLRGLAFVLAMGGATNGGNASDVGSVPIPSVGRLLR